MGYFYEDDDTLEHHGVKGQKLGVRRFQNSDGTLTTKGKMRYGEKSDAYNTKKEARANLKTATEKYNRTFNRAYNNSGRIGAHITKAGREHNNKLWGDFQDASKNYDQSKGAYKDAKKAYKDEYKKNLEETRSKATLKDKLLYNDATRTRAAKIMTKYKDISYEEATKQAKKEAARNTAIVLGAYGAVAVGALVAAQKTKEKGKHAYFVKTLEF